MVDLCIGILMMFRSGCLFLSLRLETDAHPEDIFSHCSLAQTVKTVPPVLLLCQATSAAESYDKILGEQCTDHKSK